ncbi:MAG: hypothetical protein GY870_12250, partial [archaeon]|nr:hypothetical protein [archaeon]
MGITGIRRRETAEESTGSFFQTTKLIASHFRREADKKEIYKLCSKDTTLTNLLVASSVVHAYHYLGIHTMNTLESGNISVENAKNVENMEKKDLFDEISSLSKKSLNLEIELLNYENEILQKVLMKIKDIKEEIPEAKVNEFKDEIEDQITEILHKYPKVCFFDYIGNLLGYSERICNEIITRSSKLRIVSRNIEEELIQPGREDDYLELSLLKGVQEKIMKDFEFDNLRELEMEAMPMRMLLKQILNHLFNIFPISQRGLDSFLEAIKFKQVINNKFLEANNKTTNYESFETEILSILKEKMKEISINKSSNELIYFIQSLTGKGFHEVIEMFNRFGITDIPEFTNQFKTDLKKFFQILKMYGINKMDIKRLSRGNVKNNPLTLAESALQDIKKELPELKHRTLQDLIENPEMGDEVIFKDISKKINVKFEDLKKYFRKKQLIENKIIPVVNAPNYNTLILLIEYEENLENIVREIYFLLFSKITRQISRILESYIKIKEDKSIFLLGMRKISSTTEDWVAVKIEELIIQRILERQSELAMIFNAERDPFLVNGFMISRFNDQKLSEAIDSLTKDPSSVYFDVKQLSLPKDLISPVSYCIAFDLLERYKLNQERRILHVESVQIKEKEKKEKQKTELKKAQQQSTFNWIDRKITGSMMTVANKGINPTTLYWSEKDNAICS